MFISVFMSWAYSGLLLDVGLERAGSTACGTTCPPPPELFPHDNLLGLLHLRPWRLHPLTSLHLHRCHLLILLPPRGSGLHCPPLHSCWARSLTAGYHRFHGRHCLPPCSPLLIPVLSAAV
ncbi:hypothetical protein ACOMHN_030734 [Nucella lapillus]